MRFNLSSRYHTQLVPSNGLPVPGSLYRRLSCNSLDFRPYASHAFRFSGLANHNSRFSSSTVKPQDTTKMKCLVYSGLNRCEVRDCAKPSLLSPTDAVVQMSHTSICGTDLHILQGDVPTVETGRILGHEGVGTITALGSAINDLFVGDTVLISCISSCGTCTACKKGLNSHCTTGGWTLGNVIDGTQAEYVRIPHANNSLYKLSGNFDLMSMVTLSDAFPTGMECGAINANVQPGSSVAIVGAGPVGLAAMLSAKLYNPYLVVVIDIDDTRLKHAYRLGADKIINTKASGAMEELDSVVEGKGFDSVIEAVGTSSTFDLCQKLVGPGGALANVGVHGKKVTLDIDELWDRNISIKTRLVDTVTIPILLRLVKGGRLKPSLITHRYPFSEILKVYEILQSSQKGGILKAGISFG